MSFVVFFKYCNVSGNFLVILETYLLTLNDFPVWSYIKAHHGPFRPGDMYDLTGWTYITHFGLYCVENIIQVYVVRDYEIFISSHSQNPIWPPPVTQGHEFEIQKC